MDEMEELCTPVSPVGSVTINDTGWQVGHQMWRRCIIPLWMLLIDSKHR